MNLTMRYFWRVGGTMLGVLALGACAVGVPDETDDTQIGHEDDGLTLPGQTINATPSWVGDCSQSYATYLVRRKSGTCVSFGTDGGAWMGCRMHPDQTDYCIYKWNKATPPSDAAYLVLQSFAAEVGYDEPARYAIAADCGAPVATCGTPMQSGTLAQTCGTPEECCEMKGPMFTWFPATQDCRTSPKQQPSCDVCGFIRNGTLFVVHDPRWPDDTDGYAVIAGRMTWTVRRPSLSVQSFQIPGFVTSPFSAYYNTRVTIYPL